jgi:hypothetical protein
VRKGVKVALEVGAILGEEKDEGNFLGSKLGASRLSIESLFEVANGGGGGDVLIASKGVTWSSSPPERRAPVSARLLLGFVTLGAEGDGEALNDGTVSNDGSCFGGEGKLVEVGGMPNTGPPNTFVPDPKALDLLPNTEVVPVFPKTDGAEDELTS